MDALRRFVAAALRRDDFALAPASADASFRSYWRASRSGDSWIVMDAPPALEDVRPWLAIGERLARARLHTPAVLARDLAQGFLLLEDFGTRTLLPELTAANVDAHYAQALHAVLTMQCDVDCADLPSFDADWATQEMELMPTWFLQRHLGIEPGCDGWDELELGFRRILDALAAQPSRFMHRDFHSRNLMIVAQNNPGIIDFQGAMRGPIAYDAASLLRDCYVEWPPARVAQWAEDFRRRLVDAGITDADSATFRRWFDFTGLQRHLKVLGIFCRLHYRDGKAAYLADLPLVLRYVLHVARSHEELAGLVALLERATAGRDITHASSAA
jgi:hypothetical protein